MPPTAREVRSHRGRNSSPSAPTVVRQRTIVAKGRKEDGEDAGAPPVRWEPNLSIGVAQGAFPRLCVL